ncbi:hypothetical protein Hanom_Chr17g01577831 [Helianthus anomalus]
MQLFAGNNVNEFRSVLNHEQVLKVLMITFRFSSAVSFILVLCVCGFVALMLTFNCIVVLNIRGNRH